MGGCGVKVQHFPLTLLVVLTALTLPCERDIMYILITFLYSVIYSLYGDWMYGNYLMCLHKLEAGRLSFHM